jgi:hypothetical protein
VTEPGLQSVTQSSEQRRGNKTSLGKKEKENEFPKKNKKKKKKERSGNKTVLDMIKSADGNSDDILKPLGFARFRKNSFSFKLHTSRTGPIISYLTVATIIKLNGVTI